MGIVVFGILLFLVNTLSQVEQGCRMFLSLPSKFSHTGREKVRGCVHIGSTVGSNQTRVAKSVHHLHGRQWVHGKKIVRSWETILWGGRRTHFVLGRRGWAGQRCRTAGAWHSGEPLHVLKPAMRQVSGGWTIVSYRQGISRCTGNGT